MAIFDKNEKNTLIFSALAHGYTHFYMAIFTATILFMAADFKISIEKIGIVGTIFSGVFGFGALAAGFLIHRISAKTTIMISLTGGTLFTFLTAFMPSLFLMALSLTIMGAFGALYHPAGLTLVSNTIKSRGRGLAIHGMGGTTGLAIAPMFAGFLTEYLSWRWAYALLAAPGVLLLIYGLTIHIKEENIEGVSHKKKTTNGNGKKPAHPADFLIYVFALQICFGLFFNGSTTFLPSHATDAIGFSFLGMKGMALGGFFTTIALVLGGLLGQFIGGELSEKYKLYKLQFFVMLVSAPTLFLLGVTTDYLFVIIMFLFALFAFSWQPIGNGMVAYYTPAKFRGYVFGISFALSFGVGALASWLAGIVTDSYSIDKVFFVMGLIAIVSLLFAVPLWLINKRHENDE
ncbi:MAG: MFS transporter [Acidobacteria bacterium]|nr:MFS transporter [Acidobacteriota bacterium]